MACWRILGILFGIFTIAPLTQLTTPPPRAFADDATPADKILLLTTEQLGTLEHHFNATKVEQLENGSVRLTYDFESMNDELTRDWGPDIDQSKGRIRWSRQGEGGLHFVEHGLIIANRGVLLHRAVWQDARVDVDYMSVSGCRKSDVLAAVFSYDKGRRIVGVRHGEQCARFSAKSLKAVGRAIPRRANCELHCDQRLKFGYRLESGVLAAYRGSARTADTADTKHFLKKLTPGHPGLLWNGNIQGYVFSITIEGKLDSQWLQGVLAGT